MARLIPSVSAALTARSTQNCGSWVRLGGANRLCPPKLPIPSAVMGVPSNPMGTTQLAPLQPEYWHQVGKAFQSALAERNKALST
jgi:hypothetical protein